MADNPEQVIQRMIDDGADEATIREVAASMARASKGAPTAAPDGPSTRGFLQNAIESTGNLGKGIMMGGAKLFSQSPMKSVDEFTAGAAKRLHEYADDIHPAQAGVDLYEGHPIKALSNMLPVSLMYKDPAGVAADAVTAGEGARGILSAPGKVKSILEDRQLQNVDRFMPNTGGPSPAPFVHHDAPTGATVSWGQRPPLTPDKVPYGSPNESILSQWGKPAETEAGSTQHIPYPGFHPAPEGPPSGARLLPGSPRPESAQTLDGILKEMLGNEGESTWGKPEPTITGGGREPLAGTVGGKKGKDGERVGGRPNSAYSSGRPSVSLERYDEMQYPTTDEGVAAHLDRTQPERARMAAREGESTAVGAHAGPVAGESRILPQSAPILHDTPMTLDELRQYQGAAKTVDDPRVQEAFKEVGMTPTRGAIQDMTGGPSRTPIAAREAESDSSWRRFLQENASRANSGVDPTILLEALMGGLAGASIRGPIRAGVRALPSVMKSDARWATLPIGAADATSQGR